MKTTISMVILASAVIYFSLVPVDSFADEPILEEVTVTAQKREESLMDVPISISAVNGEKIKDANIQRFEELTAYVPNFQVTQDPIGDKINIRGIQSGTQAGFEQSVATFVDGIYRGRGIQSRYAFLDIAMVEVLRGPQPTLFGKNTIAGALNIRTAKPTAELATELSALYNPEFETSELQGYVSGPISDTLRGRLTLLGRKMREGWVHNQAYDENNPDQDEFFARVSLEWDAGDHTLVSFRYEMGDFKILGQPWVLAEAGPLAPILDAAGIPTGKVPETSMGNNGFGPYPGDPVLDFGSVAKLDGDSSEAALSIEHDLASGSMVTAILGYSEYQFDRFLDADFNPLSLLRFDDSEDFEQTSFELRLTSDTGGTLEYIAGAYYQDNNLFADGLTQFNMTGIGGLLGGSCAQGGAADQVVVTGDPITDAFLTAMNVAINVPGSSASLANACAQFATTQTLVPAGATGAARYAYMDQQSTTGALFTQITWNVSDMFRATLGLRYTREKKKAAQGVYAAEYGEENTKPLDLSDPANLAQAAASFLIGEFTPHAFSPSDPGMSRSENSFTWSANLQYHVNEGTMIYGTAATGFKAGGFNSFYMGQPLAAGASSTDVPFEEEDVLSFEVGTKIRLLEGAAELNVAAFRAKYDDMQVAIFSGDTTFLVQNAAKAISQGIEVDGRWQATESLMLQASLGYLDFEWDEFPNQACTAAQLSNFRESAYQAGIAANDFVAAAGAALLINNGVCSAAAVNDLAGKTGDNSPQWNASFIATHVHSFGRYELLTSLDINYMDKVFRAADLDPASMQDGFTKINASLIFGPSGGWWDIALIGKNLTDESTYSFVNDVPTLLGTHFARLDAPRSIAARVRFRY